MLDSTEGAKLQHDATQRHIERASTLVTSGARGIAVLNSGAAIAVLGMFSALAGKDVATLAGFKAEGLWALGIFLSGALLSTWTFALQHSYLRALHSEKWEQFERAHRLLWLYAAGCFLVGACIAGYGIWYAFI
jgi:hypothetical protein